MEGSDQVTVTVWIHIDPKRTFPWCVLRRAIVGGRISTLCLAGDGFEGAVPYGPVLVTTEHPAGLACPACERELAAGTPGAAHALEPEPHDDLRIHEQRTPTRDLRPRVEPELEGPEYDFEGEG